MSNGANNETELRHNQTKSYPTRFYANLALAITECEPLQPTTNSNIMYSSIITPRLSLCKVWPRQHMPLLAPSQDQHLFSFCVASGPLVIPI
jgi:hypothetical protein